MKPTPASSTLLAVRWSDEQALVRRLQEKWIAGAALDAESEPPATDAWRVWTTLSYAACGVFSSPAVARVPQRCGEEAARVLTGQRLCYVVNPEVYQPCGSEAVVVNDAVHATAM